MVTDKIEKAELSKISEVKVYIHEQINAAKDKLEAKIDATRTGLEAKIDTFQNRALKILIWVMGIVVTILLAVISLLAETML